MASRDNEVFCGGATTSQHVDAEDDEHFENTTFKLKRTRLLGLLDEFIPKMEEAEPTDKEPGPTDKEPEAEEAKAAVKENAIETHQKEEPDAADLPHDDLPQEQEEESELPTDKPYLPEMVPHDDTDIGPAPWRHVDYLLHQWDVLDISKLWRYVILRRKNVANAARLENALWRTWAQRRLNLKTISPEAVNWLKDLDVTWLYGPIVDDEDHEQDTDQDLKDMAATVAGDLLILRKPRGPKPILKKRTVEDMMVSHLDILKLQLATLRAEQQQRRRDEALLRAAEAAKAAGHQPPEYFDYLLLLAKLNAQYRNYLGAPSKEVLVEPAAPRRIHFSDEVQQCIALSYLDHEYSDYDYESFLDNGDSSLDDGVVFNAKLALANGPELAARKDVPLARLYSTIQLLPPTTINYGSLDEELDALGTYTLSLLHNVDGNTLRGYNYYYDYNSVYEVDPNHAIYGKKADVVDVPEDLAMGSNFNFDIENDMAAEHVERLEEHERLPILLLDNSARNPFALDLDLDLEDGALSIRPRRLSQLVAELVLGPNYFPQPPEQPPEQPEVPVSTIVPSHLSSLLLRQPHSLSSLLQQFGGLTLALNAALAELFLETQHLKTPPLPPTTTLATAKGELKLFLLDVDSSDEDSGRQSPSSYALLYLVADKNGLTEGDEKGKRSMANILGWKG